MAELTKEDKLQIISSHKRNLEFRKYGFELDIIQENAKSSPNSDLLSKLEESVSEIEDQVVALNQELAAVNALTE